MNDNLNNQNINNNMTPPIQPNVQQGFNNIVPNNQPMTNIQPEPMFNNVPNNNMMPNNNVAPQSKKKSKLLLIIIIIILLGGLGTGAFFILNKSNSSKKDESKEQQNKTIDEDELKDSEVYYILSRNNDKKIMYFGNLDNKIVKFDKYGFMGYFFYHNTNYVTMGEDHAIININDEYIVEPGKYDYINRINEELYSVKLDDKYGVVNYKGEEIIKPTHDYVGKYDMGTHDIIITTDKIENTEQKIAYTITGKKIGNVKDGNYPQEVKKHCNKCNTYISYNNNLYNLYTGEIIEENYKGRYMYSNVQIVDNKTIIYDENHNVFKKYDTNEISIDNNENLVIHLNDKYIIINKDLEISESKEIEANSEKEKLASEGFTQMEKASYHTFQNGEKYITTIREEDNVVKFRIYNAKAELQKEIELPYESYYYEVETVNNYFIVHGNNKMVIDAEGNIIITNAYSVDRVKDDYIAITGGEGYTAKTTIIGPDVKIESDIYYHGYIETKDGFLAYSRFDGVDYYTNEGEKTKIIDYYETIEELGKNKEYVYIYSGTWGGSKYLTFSKKTDKVTLESPESELEESGFRYYFMPKKIVTKKTNIIEINISENKDGFYDLDGNLLLEKKE